MKWFEYKMELDSLHASDELKARLLAMQPETQAGSTAAPPPAQKKRAVRFGGWRRWASLAACVALVFVAGSALYLTGAVGFVTLRGAGSANSTAAVGYAGDQEAAYSSYSLDNSLADAGGMARSAAGTAGTDAAAATAGEKIIYNAWLELETKDYDAAFAALQAALEQAGGYVESSSESNYTGTSRSLSLTLRIPEANYDSFLSDAAGTASLLSKSEEAQDVTAQYMDVAARIENLEAQRSRLLELQAGAESLSDLLDIESKLSDVQYQLESWQSQLDWYDDQVSCCTVTVTLREVETYTPTTTSLPERLAAAFGEGWQNFTSGLAAVLVGVVSLWPLVLLAAVIAAVVLIRRRRR